MSRAPPHTNLKNLNRQQQQQSTTMAKKHIICPAAELPAGARKIVQVGSRSIGVFNVGNRYYAMLNVCPHQGANICAGPLGGTNKPVSDYEFCFEDTGTVLRCARHGWEFDITSGENLDDPTIRAKTYPAFVENGEVVVEV